MGRTGLLGECGVGLRYNLLLVRLTGQRSPVKICAYALDHLSLACGLTGISRWWILHINATSKKIMCVKQKQRQPLPADFYPQLYSTNAVIV